MEKLSYQKKRFRAPPDALKKIQLPLHRLINVAIPLQLEMLNKHKDNISKYKSSKQWDKVNAEYVNSSRTLKQLKVLIEDLELLSTHLEPSELDAFEERTHDVKQQSQDAIHSFIEEHKAVLSPLLTAVPSQPLPEDASQFSDSEEPEEEQAAQEFATLKEDKAKYYSMLHSSEKLKEDIIDLKAVINKFSSIVHNDQETINSIEENVNEACDNVTSGTKELRKVMKKLAAFLKMAAIPLTGALIGGILGGPLGIAVGIKLLGAATLGGGAGLVGGGAMGYASGKYIQQKKNEQLNSIEMETIEKKSS